MHLQNQPMINKTFHPLPNSSIRLMVSGILALLMLSTSCNESTTTVRKAIPKDFRDNHVSEYHNLSWLGGKSHPIRQSFQMADPDNLDVDISPGGIVVTEVTENFPLHQAGIQAGDALVRVSGNWLPIKEDPTLDLFKLIEDQINARKEEIGIGFIRDGKYESVTIKTELVSLDEDLPLANRRMIDASRAMLENLAAMQNENGSFAAATDNLEHRLTVTSICGLAFLSADPSIAPDFNSKIEKVTNYLSVELADAEVARELNPLTVAYICCYLAESGVIEQDSQWKEIIGVLTFAYSDTQDESGGWNVMELPEQIAQDAPEDSETSANDDGPVALQPDVFATFSTNMVLASIGVLERAGVQIDNEIVENGVAFLREQANIRIPSSLDRRLKGLLSAGTVVGLVAINIDRDNAELRQYMNEAQDRAHDIFSSPALGLPGMLSVSVAARQLGNESWLQLHQSVKHLLVSMQDHDGAYAQYPGVEQEPLEFEKAVSGAAWETAHVALMYSMQSQGLKKLLAIDQPANLLARDESGKKISKADASARVMKLDAKNMDAEAIKQMIMEQLKEQGMDVDPSKMKIQSTSDRNN